MVSLLLSGNPEKTWGCHAHHLGTAITARILSLRKTHLFERESPASLQAIMEGSKERIQVQKMASTLMLGFHRSRLRADLEILYDRGVVCSLILNGRFVLGYPWLNLTDRGQYQTRLIFSTTSKIQLVGELILHLIAGHPRSPYIWSFIACGDLRWPAVALDGPIYLVPDVIAGHHRWPYT